MKTSTSISVALLLGALAVLAIVFRQPVVESLGSVQQGNDYHATSTGGNQISTPNELLLSGVGALSSVTITGANTGIMHFYNATTTNVLKRTGQPATATIWVASIPASTAAGTYVFDAIVTDGLLMEIIGTEPTSTVTFRQY